MELAILVYLASIVVSVRDLFLLFSIISIIVFAVGFFGYMMSITTEDKWDFEDDGVTLRPKVIGLRKLLKKTGMYSLIVFITTSIIVTIIPKNEKSIYMMAGAYGVQQVAGSEVGKDIQRIIAAKLKGYAEEAEEELKGAKK